MRFATNCPTGLSLASLALSLTVAHAAVAQEYPIADPIVEALGRDAQIGALIADYEDFRLAYDPAEAARAQGRLSRQWQNVTPNRQAEQLREARGLLSRLDTLGPNHTLDTAILESILTSFLAVQSLDPHRVPFTGDSGFHSEPIFAIGRARIRDRRDAEDLIARINAIPGYFDQHIQNMRRGIATGFTAHTDPLDTVISQVAEQMTSAPGDSVLFSPFANLPETIPPGDAIRLREAAATAIGAAVAAYGNLHDFLTLEYRPYARSQAGIAGLPGGRDIYRAMVAKHTTRPDLTPEIIHSIGLAEVARIRAEMEQVIIEADFDGSFAEFLNFLRTDPQFYAETPAELLAEASVLAKQLDAALPRFFNILPRLTYGVAPVPSDIAPGYTTARYAGGDAATGRAGTYLVNTYRLDQRPLYELPALTAHEAVPGHHLQIALAQELSDVPEFRRAYYATAFGEGWGLYAERIAGEAGLYDTPYKRFGALSYEMWRACRLVADTGLHWYGWTREEAEACFRDNSALSELNIKTEVTRYIGWPGQALGYKIGEITIRDLRRQAETALGDSFDIRDFHDVVLSEGAMPLSLLESRVRQWIAEQRLSAASGTAIAP
ncbi:MAG: DUF885 domain-containing protein [Pseudomonadota bacterium]